MSAAGSRLIGLVVLSVALVWLLARGYADYLARPAPERALSLNSGQPEALILSAQGALGTGDLDVAVAMASRAVAAHPFEGRALRLLGAVAEQHGDRDRAHALMRLAVATAPRDSAAQFWLAINALIDKDLDGALQRLDRLLRFEPGTYRDVFPILATIALNPIGVDPLSTYLAADVPWRPGLMGGLVAEAASSTDVARLYRAIVKAGGEISEGELDLLANRLLTRREWPQLRKLILARAPDSATRLLHDGEFDGVGRGPLLGWSVGKVPGADVLMATPADAGNRALRLVFHDRRVPFRHVSQTLLLQPGQYQFSGRTRLEDLRTALGLGWNLTCIESNASLGKSERLLGSSGWRDFSFAFVVPEANCGAQLLQLVLDARIAAEQQVAGAAWFDDLKIQRLDQPDPATSPAPPASEDRAK
jgi:tetratricopeptide (TPR) repeat protein